MTMCLIPVSTLHGMYYFIDKNTRPALMYIDIDIDAAAREFVVKSPNRLATFGRI